MNKILRAGPWGDGSDAFKNVPSDTTADELTLYPVNCAKTNWLSGQAWGAYYEIPGCCTSSTYDFSWDGISGTLERAEPPEETYDACEYYTWENATYYAILYYNTAGYGSYPTASGTLYYYGGWNLDVFQQSDDISVLYGVSTCQLTTPTPPADSACDRCDPTGTYDELFDYFGGAPSATVTES
jgi:hypothetical protein